MGIPLRELSYDCADRNNIKLPRHSGRMERKMSNFMNKMLNFVGFDTDEEYNEDYYMNNQDTMSAIDYDGEPMNERINARRSSRVVRLHDNPSQQMKVVVMQPESFEEARDITNHLKNRKPIVVNLESVEKEVARRIVDFLSGAVYALDGDIQKISNGIFLLAPHNVGIMGYDAVPTKSGFTWGN